MGRGISLDTGLWFFLGGEGTPWPLVRSPFLGEGEEGYPSQVLGQWYPSLGRTRTRVPPLLATTRTGAPSPSSEPGPGHGYPLPFPLDQEDRRTPSTPRTGHAMNRIWRGHYASCVLTQEHFFVFKQSINHVSLLILWVTVCNFRSETHTGLKVWLLSIRVIFKRNDLLSRQKKVKIKFFFKKIFNS